MQSNIDQLERESDKQRLSKTMSLGEAEKWVFMCVYVSAGRGKCARRADVKLSGKRHSAS